MKRLSEARDEAVEDSPSIVPDEEAPADERQATASLPPYFIKHLTCTHCCGRLIAINGLMMCEDCGYMEGCCD